MSALSSRTLPGLKALPKSLRSDSAVRIDLQTGAPVLRASTLVQDRMEELLRKQQDSGLSSSEIDEFGLYE